METRRLMAAVGLILALAVQGLGDDRPDLRRYEFTEPHMGTAFTLILYSGDEATASRASRAAFDRIKQLDQTLTDYDPESELMRLAARAGGPPVSVGPARRPSTSGRKEPSTSRSPRSSGSGDEPAARRSCPTPSY
jgi:thiamine biosynthesis lipoprotein ApbE